MAEVFDDGFVEGIEAAERTADQVELVLDEQRRAGTGANRLNGS